MTLLSNILCVYYIFLMVSASASQNVGMCFSCYSNDLRGSNDQYCCINIHKQQTNFTNFGTLQSGQQINHKRMFFSGALDMLSDWLLQLP